jgi:hypothetical protein
MLLILGRANWFIMTIKASPTLINPDNFLIASIAPAAFIVSIAPVVLIAFIASIAPVVLIAFIVLVVAADVVVVAVVAADVEAPVAGFLTETGVA